MGEAVAKIVELPRFRLRESQVARFEHDNTVWSVSVDPMVPFEEILKPEFWAHVVGPKNFKIGDEVKVTPFDQSWRAVLLVRDCGPNWAKVALIQKSEFEERAQDAASVVDGYSIEWKGPVNKYAVIRNSDKAMIAKGYKTKPEAQIAMIEHARTVGAA